MGMEEYTCKAFVDCSWIETIYSLKTDMFRLHGNSCVVEKHPVTCSWTGNITMLTSNWNPRRTDLIFFVNAMHSLASSIQQFGLNIYEIVKPKGPEQLFIVVKEVHLIKVEWFPSKTANILNLLELQYKISVEEVGKIHGHSVIVGTKVFQYTIKNLQPYTSYKVSVSCRSTHTDDENMWSAARSIIAQTLATVPGQMDPPVIVAVGRTELTVFWKPPKEPNGPLNAYQLHWQSKDRRATTIDVIANLNISISLYCLPSACEAVTYEFHVRASNIQNGKYLYGIFSPPVHFEACFNISDLRTVNFMLLDVTFTTVTVGWELLCLNQRPYVKRFEIRYCQSTECKAAMKEPDETNCTLSNLKPATTYRITIILFNLNNKTGEENEVLMVTTLSKESSSITATVLSVVGILVIIILLFWTQHFVKLWMRTRERLSLKSYLFHQNNNHMLISNTGLDDQDAIMPLIQKIEFTKDRLKMGNVLGEGAFGRVVKAEAVGLLPGQASTTVAVKMFRDGENREQKKALISELKILAHIGRHVNIVNMLGAVTKNIMKGELFVILEYCALGNLQRYLQKYRKFLLEQWDKQINNPIPSTERICGENVLVDDNPSATLEDLLRFAFQCAKGMEYLSSRKFIHRDVAARNVLLTQEKIVKICDFGLTKDCYKDLIYSQKSKELLPVKWMAIESIQDHTFSSKSDVWSFGVLLWEIYSLGSNPYPGIMANREFFKLLKDGYRMEKPDLAPEDVYQIMLKCWLVDPDERPEFSDLVTCIGTLLQETVRQFYLDLNEPYEEMNKELSGYGYLAMDLVMDNSYTKMLQPCSSIEEAQSSDESETQTTEI